jgi:hypothetical protein
LTLMIFSLAAKSGVLLTGISLGSVGSGIRLRAYGTFQSRMAGISTQIVSYREISI